MSDDKERCDRYKRVLRRARASVEPEIIIWGPGPRRLEGYQKRECVRKAIQDELPHGTVSFPEDNTVHDASSKVLGSEDLLDNELLQALAADIVIALDIAPAVGEEVAKYSTYRKLAGKLFIVAPEERKSGYQEAIRNKVSVRYVKTDEMATCEKATQFCIAYVRAWCVQKYAEE